MKHAVEETTEAGWGVKFETWVKAQKPGLPAPQTPLFKSDLGQMWHPSKQIHHRCWDKQDIVGKPEPSADPALSDDEFPVREILQPLPVNGGRRNRRIQDPSEPDPDTQSAPDGTADDDDEADVAPESSLVPRRKLQAEVLDLPKFPTGGLQAPANGSSRQLAEGHNVAKPGGTGHAHGHTNAPSAAGIPESPRRLWTGRVTSPPRPPPPPPPPPPPHPPNSLVGKKPPTGPNSVPGNRPPRRIASPPPHNARVGVLD